MLQQVPLLHGLSPRELASVDARMTSLAWSEGQDLYAAGDPAEHLFVLASGRAKAVHATPDGDEHVVDLLAPGDLFGGLRLLGANEHSETVRAMTTICALRVDTGDFRKILLEHPEVAVRALEMTADRLAQARSSLSARSLAPVPQRVAAVLLRLARKFGQRTPDGAVLIQLPLSRADIASIAGSTPESVSRAMSRWRTEGIIDSGRRWTEIRRPERLEQIAAGQ
ncbi:Crp/Fnr family transcriptional regulator [Georgenia sp. H159]|uniref:Crp/Fnr family transcriptional regulator n=1 Tax=Georgenia sp. H159 TaxID=3076115 RepID=UPI002D78E9A7|nr:Crp/Fnr family transcriptional regulator [Georgenia sp. H159]